LLLQTQRPGAPCPRRLCPLKARYIGRVTARFQDLAATISTRVPDTVAVYLFGSQARADGAKDADIDLAVLAREKLDPVTRWKLQEDLAAQAHRSVDLVDLADASTVMRMEVLRDSVVLLDLRQSTREAFEMTALSSYARLNEERRGILEDIKARGRVYR
jgi:uncharacterized protein